MEWNSYEEVNFEYLANFDFVNIMNKYKYMKLNVNQNIEHNLHSKKEVAASNTPSS